MSEHRQITLVTCSGLSNTGKLTLQAGAALLRRSPGLFDDHIPARCPTGVLEQAAAGAEYLVVLDGCSDCCGRKKLQALGIEPHLHIIATSCGIEKNGMAEPRFDEIERLAAVVREAIRR